MRSLVSIALVLAGCGSSTPPAECPPCAESTGAVAVQPQPQPDPEPEQEPDQPIEEPPGPLVNVGECELDWLPPGIVEDVPAEATEQLVEIVRAWIADPTISPPAIDSRQGILHAKSEDDLGADPPYPTHTQPGSGRACSSESIWLRDHLRAELARQASEDYGGVTCQKNVCCFSGMEYQSDGVVVFRQMPAAEGNPPWVLRASYEVAEAVIGEEYIRANRAYVARELTRLLRGSCPREPAGFQ